MLVQCCGEKCSAFAERVLAFVLLHDPGRLPAMGTLLGAGCVAEKLLQFQGRDARVLALFTLERYASSDKLRDLCEAEPQP